MDLYQLTSNWVTDEWLATKISKSTTRHQDDWSRKKNVNYQKLVKTNVPSQPNRRTTVYGISLSNFSGPNRALPTSDRFPKKFSCPSVQGVSSILALHLPVRKHPAGYKRALNPWRTHRPLVVISNHTNWKIDDDNRTPCGNSKKTDERSKSTISWYWLTRKMVEFSASYITL